jgi:hypothetical protein
MNLDGVSVKADCKRCKDRREIGFALALDRGVDMFKACLDRDAVSGEQGKLGRAPSEAFQSGKAVESRKVPNRVHSGVEIEGREARACLAYLGHAKADLVSHPGERIGGHQRFLLLNADSPRLVKRPLQCCVG